MKKIILSIAIVLLFCSFAFGQDNKGVTYIQFDFHKVETDKIGEYIKAEQAWKKVHESDNQIP